MLPGLLLPVALFACSAVNFAGKLVQVCEGAQRAQRARLGGRARQAQQASGLCSSETQGRTGGGPGTALKSLHTSSTFVCCRSCCHCIATPGGHFRFICPVPFRLSLVQYTNTGLVLLFGGLTRGFARGAFL